MKQELYQKITDLIIDNIQSGGIDRLCVQQIIVGLSQDGQSISIWQQEEWDDYNEYEDDKAIAEISNLDWLEELDRIGFDHSLRPWDELEASLWLPDMGIRFTDSALQDRYRKLLTWRVQEIKAALLRIAQEQLLGEFTKLLGLMGLRTSNSTYADLVAIYHPQGGDIMPARERRLPGYSSIYGVMALTDEGLIHFYTDSEDEDDWDEEDEDKTSDDQPARIYNDYTFSDMDYVVIDDDDNELVFRLSSSGQEFEFNHGHDHEEWGGLSQVEIDQRLLSHFRQKAPQLCFDLDNPPPQSHQQDWEHWLGLYNKTDKKSANRIVCNMVKNGNLEQAKLFIESQNLTPKEATPLHKQFLYHYSEHAMHEKTLALILEAETDTLNVTEWQCYYRAMLMLGKGDDICTLATQQLTETKPDDRLYYVHSAYLTIAGIIQQKPLDYVQILADVDKNDYDEDIYRVAYTLVHYSNDKPQSQANIAQLLRERSYSEVYARLDLASEPELLQHVINGMALYNHKVYLEPNIQEMMKVASANEGIAQLYHPLQDFLDQWATSKKLKRFRVKEAFQVFNEKDIISSELFNAAGERWVSFSNKQDGFARIVVDDKDKVNFVNRVEDGDYYYALVSDGHYLYALTNDRFNVFSYDLDSDTPPEKVSSSILKNKDRPDNITCSGDTVVITNGSELEIYDVSDRENPITTGLVSLSRNIDGFSNFEHILLKNSQLYVAASDKGCFALDIHDPTAPKFISSIRLNEDINGISESNGHLALYSKNGVHFINYTDVRNPVLVKSLKHHNYGEFIAEIPGVKNGFKFIAGDNKFSWYEIDYDIASGKTSLQFFPVFAEGEKTDNIYYIKAVIPIENGYLACKKDETVLAQFEAMPMYQGFSETQINKGKQVLKRWFEEQFVDFLQNRPDDAVGSILLENHRGAFKLYLDGQRSLPRIDYGPIQRWDENFFTLAEYEGNWHEMLALKAEEEESSGDYNALAEWRDTLDTQNMDKIFREVLLEAAKSDAFQKIAPGKVYLTSSMGPFRLFACLQNGEHWQPWRRDITGTVNLTLSEILEDYNRWDTYAKKCDEDAELREELYALGRIGDQGALQVIRRRFDQDEEDSVDVLLDVILNRQDYSWITFIDDLSHRDDVQRVFKTVYASLLNKLQNGTDEYLTRSTGCLIEVAICLDYQDREELDTLIDLLLFSENVHYQHYDQVTSLLAAREDIRKFSDAIKKAIDAMEERDNRLPALAEQLFRAESYDIPKGLILQSKSEKNGEQYNDMKIGIKSLDRDTDHQYEQCRIERLFTSRMVLEHFHNSLQVDNSTDSLWPASLEPEPYPSSWKLMLQQLLIQMDIDKDLNRFIETLSTRLTNTEQYQSDRYMFKALFKMLIESQDVARYSRMIDIVQALSLDDDVDDLSELNKLRQTAEINLAVKANQDGDLDLSRKYTDKLLKEGIDNSYLYFLDARLSWLEQDKPGLAIEIGTRYIDKMHGEGKTRILNLIGCAHDELKQYPESLAFFKQASELDPDTVMYFDNIAEIYDKMSEPVKAYEWAREAKRRGSKTEIVDSIIRNNDGINTPT